MRTTRLVKFLALLLMAAAWFLSPPGLRAQGQAGSTANATSVSAQTAQAATPDVRQIAEALRKLQDQVNALSVEVSQLKNSNEEAHAETRQLRQALYRVTDQKTLNAGGARTAVPADPYAITGTSVSAAASSPSNANPSTASAADAQPQGASQQGGSLESRVAALEENQSLTDSHIQEQSQTKVESGSKYRVRFTGIILMNTFETVGAVNNLDFPETATPVEAGGTSTSFAGSLRQSQIGVQAFGPEIAGAQTSANINFDFSGGFANEPNGTLMGIPRLRTGVFRMDWHNTSIIAGQDSLFIAPLSPTSLSSLAIPALSYSGNLWAWTPQIRVEHRIELTDQSNLLLQAGILDSVTGTPPFSTEREPTAGEQSGQPAYAARVAWSHKAFGRDFILGAGGYYGRQNWYFQRNVDGWAGTVDLTVPLGRYFDFTGAFYRGRAVGGFGGGIGQGLLLTGMIGDPTTDIKGLDSMGGWAQLKYRPRANLEFNFAFGDDNPFASELRAYPQSYYYYGPLHPRNMTGFANFIWHARSNILFSVEYRRLQTYHLDDDFDPANQVGLSVGYIF
jgi:hypothetical protein